MSTGNEVLSSRTMRFHSGALDGFEMACPEDGRLPLWIKVDMTFAESDVDEVGEPFLGTRSNCSSYELDLGESTESIGVYKPKTNSPHVRLPRKAS